VLSRIWVYRPKRANARICKGCDQLCPIHRAFRTWPHATKHVYGKASRPPKAEVRGSKPFGRATYSIPCTLDTFCHRYPLQLLTLLDRISRSAGSAGISDPGRASKRCPAKGEATTPEVRD